MRISGYGTVKRLIDRIINCPFDTYRHLRNLRYFSKLRNLYKGQRAFVIGNGPSLQFEDLERLTEELTIASNKIYLSFEHTTWRPSFYTICDPMVWGKIKDEIHAYFKFVHIENTSYLPYDSKLNISARTWTIKGLVQNPYSDSPGFSSNFNAGIFNGYSVTYINLQLAAHLGANPIYLIGCDHHYSGEDALPANSEVVVEEGQVNHFIKGYREPGEIVYNAPLDDLTEAFKNARAFSELNDITICNATRGGHLEVFQRVDFDTLFDRT